MKSSKNEIITIIGKGLVGAIPFIGPLAAEIVGSIIPNQRIERIESLLKILELKITKEDRIIIEEKISSPESVDLIEDGFIQASRALSQERIDYIAALLKNSLTNTQLEHIEHKRLLSILGQLNDLEVLLLKSHTLYQGSEEYSAFWGKHESALTAPISYLDSSQEEVDKYTLFKTHRAHLASLELLRSRFKKPKRGELPEFDEKTGMVKSNGYDITPLGRLLLKNIDQSDEL